MTVAITKEPENFCPSEKDQIAMDDFLNGLRRTQRLHSNSPLTNNSSCGNFLAVINHKRKCLTFEYYPDDSSLIAKIFNNNYYNGQFVDPQPNRIVREEYKLVDNDSRKALWKDDSDCFNTQALISKWVELIEF